MGNGKRIRKSSGLLFAIAFLGLFSSPVTPASAQILEDRQYRVEFPVGTSAIRISGDITGGERLIYRLAARSGQTLDVKLTSTTRLVEFSVYGPRSWPGGRPIATSSVIGALVPDLNRYVGKLPGTGDYRIVVRHLPDLSFPGQQSSFGLAVSITGGTSADGGTASQLPGTPDPGSTAFFKVTGLAVGDRLNMRAGPGTSFRVVDKLSPGEVVKNEGCAASGATQWCEVSRPGRPRESGWVSAGYLVATSAPKPGSGQSATQLPADVPVGGTSFNATGRLPCLIGNRARLCDFGVIRRGRGNATLYIDLPSGNQRRIEFEAGRPVSSNSAGGLFGEFTGTGAIFVAIGTDERFTVDDAITFGG